MLLGSLQKSCLYNYRVPFYAGQAAGLGRSGCCGRRSCRTRHGKVTLHLLAAFQVFTSVLCSGPTKQQILYEGPRDLA